MTSLAAALHTFFYSSVGGKTGPVMLYRSPGLPREGSLLPGLTKPSPTITHTQHMAVLCPLPPVTPSPLLPLLMVHSKPSSSPQHCCPTDQRQNAQPTCNYHKEPVITCSRAKHNKMKDKNRKYDASVHVGL